MYTSDYTNPIQPDQDPNEAHCGVETQKGTYPIFQDENYTAVLAASQASQDMFSA